MLLAFVLILVLVSQSFICMNALAADQNEVQALATIEASPTPQDTAGAEPSGMEPTESAGSAAPAGSAQPLESVEPTDTAEPAESVEPTPGAEPSVGPEPSESAAVKQMGMMLLSMGTPDATANNETELNNALSNATGTAGSPYAIEITGSFSIASAKTIGTGKYVKLISSDGSTFTLTRGTTTNNVFDVQGSLALENIIIDGGGMGTAKNTVRVSSGASFTVETGSVLQNALCTSTSGSAVYNQGTFNLNGGDIINCDCQSTYAVTGGTVYNSGIFTMTAGSITGNDARPDSINGQSVSGGVVYNTGSATFTMSGGVIGGDGTDANNSLSYDLGDIQGGAVYNAGTFSMNGTALIKGNKLSRTSSYMIGSISGGAVYNSGTFTMTGSAEITGTNASNLSSAKVYGLGVHNTGASARFTMQDYAKIRNNTLTSTSGNSPANGLGVYNTTSSQFTMKDNAQISDNTATIYSDCYGGGVNNSNSAAFDFQGGTISGNSITSTSGGCFGGGVYSYNNTTITMGGGSITGNSVNASAAGSYCRGGGVFTSNATFTLSGGLISSNQANNTSGYSEGGGVFNWNIFNMAGGRITGNTAKNGGGVCNYATFNMSGSAQIDTNTASTEGGGVENNTDSTFTMSGGSIMDNTAPKGKGVLNAATFSMSGSAEIDTNNGVYLNSGKVINVTAALTGTSPFAVITPSAYSAGSTVVTLAAGLSADSYSSKFTVAPNGTTPWGIKASGQNLQLAPGAIYLDGATGLDTNNGTTKATAVASLEKASSLLGSPGTVYICGTVTVPSGNDSAYTWALPDGQTVKRYKDPVSSANDFTGKMVQVDGNLALQNIIIDGGWDASSGTGVQATKPIVSVSGTGNLAINTGAALQNNNIVISNQDGYGSGVLGNGNVTMTGGKISGNQIHIVSGAIESCGAGIAMEAGTLTMIGGTISGNKLDSTYALGGGVYIISSAAFTMSGGTIGGSTAADANTGGRGGGLYNSGTANITGGSISGNSAGIGDELGGGVFNYSVLNLSSAASITGNTAASGGGIYNLAGNLNVSGSATIDGNTATICGGGVVSNSSGRFEMGGGSISNNTSGGGGGIYVQNGTFDMTDGSVTGNSASGNAGGIFGSSASTLNISGGTISGNTAFRSGGIENSHVLNMSGGTISGNTATNGAGVYNYETFNLSGSAVIAQNNPVFMNTGTHITVTGALSGRPAVWVEPAAYPGSGGSVKVAQANYTGADGAAILNAVAPANNAYMLQASGNDVNLVKKANATITLGDASATRTGSAISYPGTVTKPADLSISDLVFLYKLKTANDSTYTATAPTNAGVYSVKATLTGNSKYGDTASNAATFTINAAASPSQTPAPTSTPSPTASPSPSAKPSAGSSPSVSQSPVASQSPSISAMPSPSVSATPSPMGSSGLFPLATQAPLASGSQENIKITVLPASVDTPTVTVSNMAELKDLALTQEDKGALQNGEEITIILKVERVEKPVNQGDYEKVAGNIGGNTLGMYLNVELLKKIGQSQQQNITSTSKPVRIILAVPPELLKDGRNYSVIRVHGNETTLLPDLDSDPATITIETDRFSTYALVYRDGPAFTLWLILIICILAAAIIILRIYISPKKRRRRSGQ